MTSYQGIKTRRCTSALYPRGTTSTQIQPSVSVPSALGRGQAWPRRCSCSSSGPSSLLSGSATM